MVPEYENCIKRVDNIFRLIGMSINKDDSNRTTLQRFKYHWMCIIHLLPLNYSIFGEFTWLVVGIATGKSFLEITYIIPCCTFCILGDFKLFTFINNVHYINYVIDSLKKLLSTERADVEIIQENIMKPWVTFLRNVIKFLFYTSGAAVSAFALGPVIIMITIYYTLGELRFYYPFFMWYPFNEFQLKAWPFVYFHHLWSAWVAVLVVMAPDCFFSTCCTFIHTQFLILQRDFEQLVKEGLWKSGNNRREDVFKKEFMQLVNRHRELIRCVELLDRVYCKSTLYNVISSSLVICATGFNLMSFTDYILMAPFLSFLFYGLLQVFFYCYYGDYVMRSSMGVGDAIYNSQWYEAGPTERRYLLTVLMRSQKSCKFTAFLFSDINLNTFTRILSTSWSYFALLKQMYNK